MISVNDKKHMNKKMEVENAQLFRVIQNNDMVEHRVDLILRLFFNSNSFQEMDSSQIVAYTDMMQKNKTTDAKLATFIYSSKEMRQAKQFLDIFRIQVHLQ